MWGFLQPLFSWTYWFSLIPEPFLGWSARVVSVFMVGLLVLGIALWALQMVAQKNRMLNKPLRHFFGQLAQISFWAGITGWLLFWFTQQRIPLLSMRGFFLVWLILFIAWKWSAWKQLLRNRSATAALDEQASYEKWLPKPKHKK